jgi:hypothetical protein
MITARDDLAAMIASTQRMLEPGALARAAAGVREHVQSHFRIESEVTRLGEVYAQAR